MINNRPAMLFIGLGMIALLVAWVGFLAWALGRLVGLW
jgi:hypothetical protein